MARMPLYLHGPGLVCSLGEGPEAVRHALLEAPRCTLTRTELGGLSCTLGLAPVCESETMLRAPFDNRVNALLDSALTQLESAVATVRERYGASRVAVLIGSCDNGSEASLAAVEAQSREGSFPSEYRLERQMADLPVRYAKERLGLSGPAMALSTACASSASAFASARNLIEAGFCDAALVGGVDIVSRPVLLGFSALEAVSPEPCNPLSANRAGINLGEGAALFLLTREPLDDRDLLLLGIGESCDAGHMTAPDPEGRGAERSMRLALEDAGLSPEAIDYLNLHGTGTPLNDAMESKAVHRVFPKGVPASSTKSLSGHTLGAAGALELAFCALALSPENRERILPAQIWDGVRDPELPAIDIVDSPRRALRLETCMSNSFAFGGCNVSIVVGRRAANRTDAGSSA